MAATLLLDTETWDLTLTAANDMAVATEPYALAQDVASECRVFLGECYYDTSIGVPYFEEVLGQPQPLNLLKTRLVEAAQRVPGVTNPVVYLNAIEARKVTGQIQFDQGITIL